MADPDLQIPRGEGGWAAGIRASVWSKNKGRCEPLGPPGGGGTPLYGLNGDVRPARVCFSGFSS